MSTMALDSSKYLIEYLLPVDEHCNVIECACDMKLGVYENMLGAAISIVKGVKKFISTVI